MKTNYFFTALMLRSEQSVVAKLMMALDLNRVVYFVLRGGNADQRANLGELLDETAVACLPLRSKSHPKTNRQMWILEPLHSVSDFDAIASYRAVLEHVFGPKTRIAVRIMKRCNG